MRDVYRKSVLCLLFLTSLALVFSVNAAWLIQTSFNSGEISPKLGGRVDLEKYSSALETCKNFVLMPGGGVVRRPGFEYIAGTKTNSTKSRLIPFEFSTEQAYMLEFGSEYMRVFADGGQVFDVDSDTRLLLHMDGTDGSTLFADSGTNGFTSSSYIITGDAQIDTAQYEFASGSYLSTAGDALSYTDNHGTDDWWHMGTNDFTVDFWVLFDDFSSSQPLFDHYVDGNNRVFLYWSSTGKEVRFDVIDATVTAPSLAGSFSPTVDTWYHVALERYGNIWTLFVNGSSVDTETDASDWPDLAAPLSIGRSVGGTNSLRGQIDEFRFSTVSRYSGADFDVPTAPYPIEAGGTEYEITTPYLPGHLDDLRYVQSADVMWVTHPDFMPRKLDRTAHDAWTITAMSWTSEYTPGTADNWPPVLDLNLTSTELLTSAATGSDITLTAGAAFFDNNDIGKYFVMHNGFGIITSVNSTTQAIWDIVDTLSAATSTPDWYESAWSADQGYPRVATFFEERLAFAGSIERPQTLWMSASGDYEDFTRNAITGGEVQDTDSLAFTISSDQVNAIRWLHSMSKLIIGTTGGEWWMTGATSSEPLTPSSVYVRRDSTFGSADVAPEHINNATMFVQRHGKKVLRYGYDFEDDAYVGQDVSILAEHLTKNTTIKEMAYQRSPYQILWAITADGTLIVLTYMREHEVVGWHRHDVDGTVESIATISGDTEDELWAIVNRTIDGGTVRYVERMHTFWTSGDFEDAFCVDSGLTYDPDPINYLASTGFDPYTITTVTANSISFTEVALDETKQAYVVKDYGAAYFDGDFRHEFQINMSSLTATLDQSNVWGMANSGAGQYSALIASEDFLLIRVHGESLLSTYSILPIEYNNSISGTDGDTLTLVLDTDYYCTVYRDESVGTFGTLYLYVYSDSDRSVEVDNSSVALTEKQDFRYLYPFSSARTFILPINTAAGVVSNTRVAAKTFTGLDHLNGETVGVLGDGVSYTASVAARSITISEAVFTAQVGLNYNSDLGTLKIESPFSKDSSQGRNVTVKRMTLRLYEAYGGSYGLDSDNLDDIVYRDVSGRITAPELFSGDLKLTMDDNNRNSGQIFIRASEPYPMSILAIVPDVVVY